MSFTSLALDVLAQMCFECFLGLITAKPVARATDDSLTPEQRDLLRLSLITSLSYTPEIADSLHAEEITKQIRCGTYAVWLDSAPFCSGEPGRFFHFHWADEYFRVRDFIGGRIFHPPERDVDDEGLSAVELSMTASEIRRAMRGKVPCLDRFGLGFSVTEHQRWRATLLLMTQVARIELPHRPT